MGNLLLSIMVTLLLLGGPITLYVVIKVLNSFWGGLNVSFVKKDDALGLLVAWDNESFELKVSRIKLEFSELVPGGRSLSHSFTFEDNSAKKRSFYIKLNLKEKDIAMLSDNGLESDVRSLNMAAASIEVENVNGEVSRFKISKKQILKSLLSAKVIPATVELIEDKNPDSWSVQTRVFPWRNVEEPQEEGAKKAAGGPAAASGPRAPVNFSVTKVWIEPGCIVCDACEAEAPAVFWVTGDTCIVRENAPLDDAAAIKAAAEGCPVDVIKYTSVPNKAANA